jgi:ribosomal protein S6--L-glutamate ligase
VSYPHVTPQNLLSLRRAAQTRGITLDEWAPHAITVWCDGSSLIPLYKDELASPDALIHRTVARLVGVVVPALRLWQERGVVVLNEPHRSELARDKLATAMQLSCAGVPYVPTLGFYPSDALALGRVSGAGVVVKPAHGLQGRNIAFFPSSQLAEKAQRAIRWEQSRTVRSEHFVTQPVIGRAGEDLRAFVVGGRCVGLAHRKSRTPSERRANLATGGRASPVDLEHPAADLAVAAASALGLDYAGVDILESEAGEFLVLEVDAWAGFVGLEEALGIDIAGAIVELSVARVAMRG